MAVPRGGTPPVGTRDLHVAMPHVDASSNGRYDGLRKVYISRVQRTAKVNIPGTDRLDPLVDQRQTAGLGQ